MTFSAESQAMAGLHPTGQTVRFAFVGAILLALAEVALDLLTWVDLDIASIYGIPLVLAAFTRKRWLLWGLTGALTVVTFVAYALQIPDGTFHLREALFVNRVLDAISLLLIASLVQIWIASQDFTEAQARLLEEQYRKVEAGNKLLVAHEAQIVAQNEELARRRKEAEEASERKTLLLNAASHDIRNPVNTINLMAQVIRRSAEDPALVAKVPQMARRLQSSAHSLVALVSEALDIAHLDSGLLQRHDTTFSLNEFIESKCRDLAPLAEAKSLSLELERLAQAVQVRTDAIKLDRILTNLVGNAIKFTSSGSVTLAAAMVEGRGVAIRVRDTGVGIAEDQLDHIFDQFAQLDLAPEKPNRGWGLGLAISRRLAHFIGAGISVESELGRGTTFTIMLPLDAVVGIAPAALLGQS